MLHMEHNHLVKYVAFIVQLWKCISFSFHNKSTTYNILMFLVYAIIFQDVIVSIIIYIDIDTIIISYLVYIQPIW